MTAQRRQPRMQLVSNDRDMGKVMLGIRGYILKQNEMPAK